MEKITYSEYLDMVRNPDTSNDELLKYVRIVKGEGGFEFTIEPDPDRVIMTPADEEFENAMSIGNGIDRFRRRVRFFDRLSKDPAAPVLVSEGDSWFQFPLLIDETIDALRPKYNVWSVGAAGDTAENMVYGNQQSGKTEYMIALRQQKARVRAFLFSAAGNDIIGEDPKTGRPVLEDLIRPFNGDSSDIHGHINLDLLVDRLQFLRGAYEKVIATVRMEPGMHELPIIIHGYDYAIPYPVDVNDPRNPVYARKDQWLGSAFSRRGIGDSSQRRAIVAFMIDELYSLLGSIAGDPATTGVWLVDCRGALPDVTDWNDEIHGTSAGFRKIGARFEAVLAKALA